MPSIAGMCNSIGPTRVSTGFAPRSMQRLYAAAASFTRKAIAQAEGPCSRAKCWPKLSGSALMMKLMSPCRCSVTFLLRCRAVTGKPSRSNSVRSSSGSDAVYSTNSNPSVPAGFSRGLRGPVAVFVAFIAEFRGRMVTIETIRPMPVKRTSRTADRLHLEHFVPYRLSVLTNIVSMSIAAAYEREFGLTIPQWRVIAVLARYPNLSAIEVAERTAMDKVAVSRAVQGLLADRRLVRTYDSGDRRRTRLRLSSTGQSVYTRVAPLALGYEKKLLNALSPTDRRALDRLVGRLIDRARRLADND